MTALVLVWMLTSGSKEAVIEERVDTQEINYVFDNQGKLVLDQIIWYRWRWWNGKYECHLVDWRLCFKCPGCYYVDRLPSGDRRTVFYDEKSGVIRIIIAKVHDETRSLYDREMTERDRLPEARRELLVPSESERKKRQVSEVSN